jgi:NAD(P)H-dependent flavin oxidoreductase YrpB (nitropropane dioxygenase family)
MFKLQIVWLQAAVLALGAEAAWVGTKFVTAVEAGAAPRHQQAIVNTASEGTIRTLIYTGRPMRIKKSSHV